jgi:hypothetical protein
VPGVDQKAKEVTKGQKREANKMGVKTFLGNQKRNCSLIMEK